MCTVHVQHACSLRQDHKGLFFYTPAPSPKNMTESARSKKKIPSVMNLNTPLLPDEWHIRGLLINKVNVYSASPFFQCQPGNGRKVTCLVRFWRFSIRVNDES